MQKNVHFAKVFCQIGQKLFYQNLSKVVKTGAQYSKAQVVLSIVDCWYCSHSATIRNEYKYNECSSETINRYELRKIVGNLFKDQIDSMKKQTWEIQYVLTPRISMLNLNIYISMSMRDFIGILSFCIFTMPYRGLFGRSAEMIMVYKLGCD